MVGTLLDTECSAMAAAKPTFYCHLFCLVVAFISLSFHILMLEIDLTLVWVKHTLPLSYITSLTVYFEKQQN